MRKTHAFLLIVCASCGARSELDVSAAPSDAGADAIAPITTRQLALGNQHSCLVAEGDVYCWGENAQGELGDGTTVSKSVPVHIPNFTGVTSIASGDAFDIVDDTIPEPHARASHTCGVVNGVVFCWGSNIAGTGDENVAVQTLSPLAMGITNVSTIAVGGFENCTIGAGASASCWGLDAEGALGDGVPGGVKGLVGVAGVGSVTSLAINDEAVCALRTDATVWCWGDNNIGELGDGEAAGESTTPTQANIDHVIQLATGWGSACAVRDDATAWCWGLNDAGQIGNGSMSTPVATPTRVSLTEVAQITTSGSHACAVLADGSLWCWGGPVSGELGIGPVNAGAVAMPAKVALENVVQVVAAFQHTCAQLADHSVWCWGNNQSGELGDGTTMDRDTPVRVMGLP